MTKDNEALIRRWFEEVWNKGREDAIDEMFAEDGIAHGLSDDSGDPLRGQAAFKQFQAEFSEAFPDVVVTFEDTIAEGDKVAAVCTVLGRHSGDTVVFAAAPAPMEITR